MNAAALQVKLDGENAQLRKLVARDVRAGGGPSPEMKAARAQAKVTWYLWCNALDVEAGRKPCFPLDELGRLLPIQGGAK